MDLHALLRALLRRWYVAAAALTIALTVTVAAAGAAPATTTARTSVLLLPPTADLDGAANPYLYLSGLGQATDVLIARLNGDDVAEPVQERHPGVTILVARDGTTTGPILLVTATGADPAEATSAVQDVLALVPEELADLQQSLAVPDRYTITSTALTGVDLEPPDTTGRTRAMLAVGVLGVGAAVLVTCAVDRLLGRWAERRRARADLPGAPPQPGGGSPAAPADDEPADDDAPATAA
ncbi:hypothetical protein [Nocardioides zeae]|uniref:Capsular polysaccharide biosynthesis protein n=1 Tax=Nocardioides zeae TaxID=1457234 RepID=A0A6P0HG61_9ACTN|nr:hypothetical protein [Nocardioides zeae]NEN77294.1 hypothetical protein [Nocardioides zeae]